MSEMTVEIGFPVNDLPNRYNITKQGVINRRKFLGIEPYRIKNRSYITEKQLAFLDHFNQYFIDNPKASMEDYKKSLTPFQEDKPMVVNVSLSEENVKAIVGKPSCIARNEYLQQCVTNQWVLTTQDLLEIINLKRLRLKSEQTVFIRHGFKFTKFGKIGKTNNWKIENDS